MRLWLLFVCGAAVGLYAQPPANFEASVKAAMAPSIAQQRLSVEKQGSATGPASPLSQSRSFFTTPFPAAAQGSADCDPMPDAQLNAIIQRESRKSGVDARLVRAVIDQESGGRPCALSAKGAQGLMQLMPSTADEYDVDDPFDPQQNVEAGAKYLRSLLDRYENDPSLALGAYNAGAGRVDQAGGVPAIPETLGYVTAILEKLGGLDRSSHDRAGPVDSGVSAIKNSGWPTEPLPIKDF